MAIIDISFVVIYVMTFVVAIFLLHRAGIKLFSVTLPSIAIGSLFIFSFIGTISMYFQFNEYTWQTPDKSINFMLLLINSYCIIAMAIGFCFANKVFKLKIKNDILNLRAISSNERVFFVIVLIVCLAVLILYLTKVPKIALITAIIDGASEAKVARSLMTNDFAGKLHRYNIFMVTLAQVLSIAFWSSFLIAKKKNDGICFFISFMIAGFAAIMSTQKGPFAWYLIELFLTWCLIKKMGNIPMKYITALGVLLISILIPFYIFFMGSDSIDKALVGMFNRAFCGEIIPAYHYLKIFPDQMPYLNGLTFPNPGGIMPYKPYRLAVEVMYKAHPELVKMGIVGSMPTAFWGESYANFGWYGILLSPFILGIVLFLLNHFINTLADNVIKIAYIVYLCKHYSSLACSGLFGFIFDDQIIILTTFYFVYLIACHPKWKENSLFRKKLILVR